jgi:superfamily I DNA/RNA helicase
MIHPNDWLPADDLTLEPNALLCAKETTRNLALIAGPGSGKTEMLAQRADFLLSTGICPYPQRILAISFKVDASSNLKQRIQDRCGSSLARRFDSYTFHGFAKRIVDRFRPLLVGPDALDPDYTIGQNRITNRQITFDDLVPFAIIILSRSAIARNALRATYGHVFLDEFQDCTRRQYELVQRAFGGTGAVLSAVGDTKQMIMSFAGAIEGIFVQFVADFQATSLNLYRNFRSKPRLLRMQNDMIAAMDPPAAVDPSEIVGDEGSIEILEFDNDRAEARSIAARIRLLVDDHHIPLSDIAIIISKQIDLYARAMTEELTELGIPWRNEQHVQDLGAEPLVHLVRDFLLITYGSREPAAYARFVSRLIDPYASDAQKDESRRVLYRFLRERKVEVTGQASHNTSFDTVWTQVDALLAFVGLALVSSLSPDYQHGQRVTELLENFKARLRQAYEEEGDVVRSINRLVDVMAVRLMTAHKSKGLEFEIVIVMGVEEETYWGEASVTRCEYFVAISRAKSGLILTTASTRNRPNGDTRRWRVNRTPHEEFLDYARPYLS